MKKGIILVVVIGIMLVILALALLATLIMTQEARLAEHKIRRIRAFFAAQAGVTYAVEKIREGINPSGTPALYIGANIVGYPPNTGLGVDIAYNPTDNSGPEGTHPIAVTVDYDFPL
ncbi:MAG: pilus assembly PilX N-terminal domain-containing protein [Candidatus Omnitrophica bacterium]|jgi:Tfp pilus assembly protein PilX|nr:pilus assembly PilX N-terminal domain-containing protein [Candidatus Omnitrophota bacterium]